MHLDNETGVRGMMERLQILVGQRENLFSWSAVKKEETRKEGALHEEKVPTSSQSR